MRESDSAKSETANDFSKEIEGWLEKIRILYGERHSHQFAEEKTKVQEFLQTLCVTLADRYKLSTPIGVGGSGIVFKATQLAVARDVVVKFNRPITDPDVQKMFRNEYEVLPLMNHPNIVKMIDRGIIKVGKSTLYFLIETLIESPQNLDSYIEAKLKSLTGDDAYEEGIDAFSSGAGLSRDAKELNKILRECAELLHQWCKAIAYVHGEGLVYLDIKPKNAMVDKRGNLVVIDFGTAQRVLETTESEVEKEPDTLERYAGKVRPQGPIPGDEIIQVFFTEYYAHPDLHQKIAESISSNRVKSKGIQRSYLEYSFDFYALGRSILRLLNIIAAKKPHDCPNLSLFRSLHFLATRLLDGKNEKDPPEYVKQPLKNSGPDAEDRDSSPVVWQTFGDLSPDDYGTLRYASIDSVITDLEKELGTWDLEKKIPELDTFARDVVRVAANFNTPLTDKLKAIIEHPVFARLKFVSQLGLASLVYPTADHSRYDHVLGTYTYTANYIKSLFEDSQNPIFRNLVNEEDIKATLLSSLLHDLGQYPLAHDLEEVNQSVFSHAKISLELLKSEIRDPKSNRRISEVINQEWGVELSRVEEILEAHSKFSADGNGSSFVSLKTLMLSALIDGPIDADKIDYITRDTVQCRIPYGNQLDIERLLHVVTVAIVPKKISQYRVTIGVYEKGKASAEAVTFARYLLYASVYWHHTSRVLKAMLQYAVAANIEQDILGKTEGEKTSRLHNSLVEFITSVHPPFAAINETPRQTAGRSISKVKAGEPPAAEAMTSLSKIPPKISGSGRPTTWYPGISYGDLLMLNWIREGLNGKGREPARRLIDAINTRDLYKRLVTFSYGDSKDIVESLFEMSWIARLELSRKLRERLKPQVMGKWDSQVTILGRKSDVEKLFDTDLTLLIDIPNPKKKTGTKKGRPLLIVPELKEKTYLQEVNMAYEAKDWSQELMLSIASVRVICHPAMRRAIAGTLKSPHETISGLLNSIVEKDYT